MVKNMKLKLKKGDVVQVIAGNDKGESLKAVMRDIFSLIARVVFNRLIMHG